jgi:putative ABC transport system permease protein
MSAHDLRYALRAMARNPGFSAVSVLALALGIGTNSAVFTVVNSVLLQPMNFYRAQELALVRERNLEAGFPQFSLSPGNYVTYRDENHSFTGIAAIANSSMNYAGAQEPERLRAARVTSNFFSVLHAQPLIGRAFTPEENQVGADHSVILSYGLWQRRFGGRREVLGERIKLNGEMYAVVGVMPKEFSFPNRNDIWRPLALEAKEWQRRGGHYLGGIARLKPGATIETAAADLNAIARRLQQAYPDSNHGWDTRVIDLQENAVGKARPMMLTILAAVGFVLLIACVNLANLLLSRSASRRREIGIRGALGAGKARLVRQLLTESLTLAAVGTALGLALAWAGTRLLTHVDSAILPRAAEISIDLRVVFATAAIGALTGILFGLAPALQTARADIQSALREGGRGNSIGFRRNLTRSWLVCGEVALAMVLLSGAGLLMRSFYRLQSVDPGFDPHGVLTFRVNLPAARYAKDEQQTAFFDRALAGIRALPGVRSAGAASIFPLAGADYILTFYQLGKPPKPPGQQDSAMYYSVTPGYFEALRIPLKAGRYFTDSDASNAPRAAIISEAMAKKFYPNENPLGQRLRVGGTDDKPAEIVGIVGDVRDEELESKGRVAVYEPESQQVFNSLYFAVRTAGDPESLISSVRAAFRGLDSELPVDAVGTVDALVETSLSQRRFSMLLMAIFATLAVLLAMIGIYGVVAYSVSQATQEIGIRMALGAGRPHVLGLVMAYGGGLIGIGVAVGTLAALAAGRLLSTQLYEVPAADPLTYGAVAAALALTGFAACVIPALRATGVDPLVALRNE